MDVHVDQAGRWPQRVRRRRPSDLSADGTSFSIAWLATGGFLDKNKTAAKPKVTKAKPKPKQKPKPKTETETQAEGVQSRIERV